MSSPKPPSPASSGTKRTLVGVAPDPGASTSAPVPRASASSPTMVALPGAGPGPRPTDPGASASMRATAMRPTADDFQAARYENTHMAGTEGLSEPDTAGGPRVRLVPGRQIPGTRFKIIRWLGEGGMGVVYEAEHIDLEQRRALKILRFDLSQEAKMAQVFRDEAKAASRVGSKNIVQIYDFGELADGRLFLAMELLPGGDLVPDTEEDWIEPARLIGLLRQICKGLAAAHDAGIVHRDIKPENIIVVEEEGREVIKLVDFGISAMLAAGKDEGNTIAGTPHYMAPEQIMGTKFDGRLDIYAMGCMAYELLVGYPPFLAEDIQALLQQQLYEEPKPLKECRPEREIPQELADVVMKCLAKEPEARWANMKDLEAALCEAQIAAGLLTPWDDLPLPDIEDAERLAAIKAGMPNPNAIIIQERNRWLLPLIAGVGALLIGIGVTWALIGGPPSQEEQDEIDKLTQEARTAASKTRWVYPPDDEQDAPTALRKVLALEDLSGKAAQPGDERGGELRVEFADTLNSLGDRYWDSDSGRPFAREYYTMALLFNPDDEEAAERTGWTPSALNDLRERLMEGKFTEAELSMGRWLNVLAEEDAEEQAKQAQALLAMELEAAKSKDRAGAALMQRQAIEAVRGAGIEIDTNLGAPPPPPPPPPPEEEEGETGDLIEDGETGEEIIEDEPSGKGGGNKRKNKNNKGSGENDEKLGTNTRDPAKAAELADQGMAALKAGRRSEAKTLFNQAISYDPRNAKALMGLSDVYFDTGSSQKAVLYAERAVKAAPKNSNYRIKLGDAYYNVLRYRDALDEYKKAKSLGSSRADSRIAKAEGKIGG